MRGKQVVGLSIALLAALVAFFVSQSLVDVDQADPVVSVQTKLVPIGTKSIYVAGQDIDVGETLSESHMSLKEWPEKAITPEMLTKDEGEETIKEKVIGSIVRYPIKVGEPIFLSKVRHPGEGGVLAAVLQKGRRAVSIPISRTSAVGGMVLPNDRVDVVVSSSSRSSSDRNVHTLLRNIKVLAVGQNLTAKEGHKTIAGDARTASLELTPRQVEILTLAMSTGEVSLSLRSIADIVNIEDKKDGLDRKVSSSRVILTRYGVKDSFSVVH